MQVCDNVDLDMVLTFHDKQNKTSTKVKCGSSIVMVYEDINDGEIQVIGTIVGFNDNEIILAVDTRIETYYYSCIRFLGEY